MPTVGYGTSNEPQFLFQIAGKDMRVVEFTLIEEMSALGSRRDLSFDDYTLANMRLAYRIHESNCEIEVQGFNLLDDNHYEFPGEAIGRQLLFGLTLRF